MKAEAKRILLCFVLPLWLVPCTSNSASDDINPGRFGTDAIFVHPIAGPDSSDSIRAQIEIAPLSIDTSLSKLEIFDAEIMASAPVATGELKLARVRATALRREFSHVFPVDVFTFYRNLDQGIDWGAEILSLRVPIRVTESGEVLIQPGFEMGIHHYGVPLEDRANFHASVQLEARAAQRLIKDLLSTGIMARLRYSLNDFAFEGQSGFQESGMAYLSLLVDRDHRLYARLYTGIEHQATRDDLGLPTANFFTGFGLFGNLSRQK